MLAPLLKSQSFRSEHLRPIPTYLRDTILDAYTPECIYIKNAFRDVSYEKDWSQLPRSACRIPSMDRRQVTSTR